MILKKYHRILIFINLLSLKKKCHKNSNTKLSITFIILIFFYISLKSRYENCEKIRIVFTVNAFNDCLKIKLIKFQD